MPIESWTAAEDASGLAAHAAAMIDAALVGTDLPRDAYWAAVRKGYNTPYNDPPRRRPAEPPAAAAPVVEVVLAADPLPMAVLATVAAEVRAAEACAAEVRLA